MIERNLGNLERLLRIVVAMLLFSWALQAPYLSITEWFIGAVAVSLLLNGVFSRCYLWYVLDINTHTDTGRRTCYS